MRLKVRAKARRPKLKARAKGGKARPPKKARDEGGTGIVTITEAIRREKAPDSRLMWETESVKKQQYLKGAVALGAS